MRDYRRLKVWERSHRLALEVYEATAAFPEAELQGLTSDIRRTSVSIPSYIAEGCGRSDDAELLRFVDIARGAASDLEYLLFLARELGYLDDAAHARLNGGVGQVRKMLEMFV